MARDEKMKDSSGARNGLLIGAGAALGSAALAAAVLYAARARDARTATSPKPVDAED